MSQKKEEKPGLTEAEPVVKVCREPEKGPGDWRWPERLGISVDTGLFWPTRVQAEDWYNNRRTGAETGSVAGNSLEAYAQSHGLSLDAALDAIGLGFLQACLVALEEAAQRGVLPPLWVRDVTLLSGQQHYEAVRKDKETTLLVLHKRLTSPIRWLGSKSGLAEYLLPLFPPHRTYVDVFAGSGSILFAKKRSSVEVYNDIDARTINLMRVLQDEATFPALHRKADSMHYARELYYDALIDELVIDKPGGSGDLDIKEYPPFLRKRILRLRLDEQAKKQGTEQQSAPPREFSAVDRACRWLVINRMNFRALRNSNWGFYKGSNISKEKQEEQKAREIEKERQGTPVVKTPVGPAVSWDNLRASLPAYYERLQGVTIENLDWREVLRRYDGAAPSTLFYLDPPYTTRSRRTPKASETSYEYEMTDADHANMVRMLLGVKAGCILSGYYNKLYVPLEEAGWVRFDKRWTVKVAFIPNEAGTRKEGGPTQVKVRKPSIESLWVSPALVEWVSFVAPPYKWCQSPPGQPPPPVEKLPK